MKFSLSYPITCNVRVFSFVGILYSSKNTKSVSVTLNRRLHPSLTQTLIFPLFYYNSS